MDGQIRVYVKLYRDLPPAEVEGALEVVHRLHHGGFLDAAVAAIPGPSGRLAIDTGDATRATFPLLPGPTAAVQPLDANERSRLVDLVAAMHELPDEIVATVQLYEGYTFFFGDRLRAALDGTERLPPRVDESRRAIVACLGRLEALADTLRRTPSPRVLTHGDLNPGNITRDAGGRLRLLDWDFVAVGPPERDLVGFAGPGFRWFIETYRARCPHIALDADRFRFYLDKWVLGEIADAITDGDAARLPHLLAQVDAGGHASMADVLHALEGSTKGSSLGSPRVG